MLSTYKRDQGGKIHELFHIYKRAFRGGKADLHTFSLAKHIVTRHHMGVWPLSIRHSSII